MATAYKGNHDSCSAGESPSVTQLWYCRGATDVIDAISTLKATVPTYVDLMPIQTINADRTEKNGFYEAQCTWAWTKDGGKSPGKDPERGSWEFEFGTSGGTGHITHAIATIGTWTPNGRKDTLFKNAINATREGVEGVEVPIPVYHFSLRGTVPAALVTPAYRFVVYTLTGRANTVPVTTPVNDYFDICELRFDGCSGMVRTPETEDDAGDWTIRLQFSAMPTDEQRDIGNGIIVPKKRGWEYLWVRYQEEAVDFAEFKGTIQKPVAATVNQVLYYGDLRSLFV